VIKPPESIRGAAANEKPTVPAANDGASLLEEAFASEIQSRQEELAPVQTPKKKELAVKRDDLDAMRALANTSARSAIRESQQRKEAQIAYAQLAGAAGAVLTGAAMIGMSESIFSFVFFGALGLWGIAGILGYRTYAWYRASMDKQAKPDSVNLDLSQVGEDGSDLPLNETLIATTQEPEAPTNPNSLFAGLQSLTGKVQGFVAKKPPSNLTTPFDIGETKTLDLPEDPQSPVGDNQSARSPATDTNPEA
jgi:hypothetical protein